MGPYDALPEPLRGMVERENAGVRRTARIGGSVIVLGGLALLSYGAWFMTTIRVFDGILPSLVALAIVLGGATWIRSSFARDSRCDALSHASVVWIYKTIGRHVAITLALDDGARIVLGYERAAEREVFEALQARWPAAMLGYDDAREVAFRRSPRSVT